MKRTLVVFLLVNLILLGYMPVQSVTSAPGTSTLTLTPPEAPGTSQRARQQETYAFATATFRLVFNRFNVPGVGYATGIRELRYVPTGKTFLMQERPTSIANTDSTSWAFPVSASVTEISLNERNLTVSFLSGKSITMRVTSHARFLEFQLLEVTGDCGEIWLFGLIFLGLRPEDWPGWDPVIRSEYNQITYLGDGYYAGLIAADSNTYPARHWEEPTSVFIRAISPPELPTPGGYRRNQRFAFFISREEDLTRIVGEVEAYFGYPYGVVLKGNRENDIDYLFLIDETYVSAQNIIELAQEMGVGAVLLYQGFWSDWRNPDEAFKLRGWTVEVVNSLKAAGLMVGLHAYAHLVPMEGYYATHYPESVSTCDFDGFRSMDWMSTLPDRVAQDLAAKVERLRPEWLYLDGQERLHECHPTSYDTYLDGRQTTAVLQELRRRNYDNLKIFQDAGGTLTYHFKSRIGQTDYWDRSPSHRTPIEHMDFTASQVIHRERGLYRHTDLGWFGREIHIPGGRREARWEEWQHLADTSLTYNIPIGVRTAYDDFMSDPLRPRIGALLRETIRARRGRPGYQLYFPMALKP
jgi:hypothetical protein